MKAQYRLKDKTSYDYVFKNTRNKINTQNFVLLIAKNNIKANRLGFVLPKKHISHACDRNKIKRLARVFFRITTIKKDLINHGQNGFDCILLSRPSIKNSLSTKQTLQPNGQIHQQLQAIWRRFIEKHGSS